MHAASGSGEGMVANSSSHFNAADGCAQNHINKSIQDLLLAALSVLAVSPATTGAPMTRQKRREKS